MKKHINLPWIYAIAILLFSLSSCGKSEGPGSDKKGEKIFLLVSKTQFEVDEKEQTIWATVSTNAPLSIKSSASWCTAKFSKEKQTDNLEISITSNSGEERSADILLTAENGPVVEIVVSQNKKAENGSTDPSEWQELNIGTYNIRVDAAADAQTGNNWTVRKEALTDLVEYFDPDIFGTQEGVTETQLVDIMTILPQYDMVKHPYGSPTNMRQSLAIYYKKEEFEAMDEGVFWLSETPDVPNSIGWDATDVRICHWAKFRHKETDLVFFFFNTHFFHTNKTARENSGPLTIDRIKSIAGSAPVFFTGDFNSQPTTSQVRAIQNHLRDAFDITETTRVGPIGTAFAGGVFEGTPNTKSRIDYIFVTDDIRVLSYTCSDYTYDNKGSARHPSDHLPLFSKVALPKN